MNPKPHGIARISQVFGPRPKRRLPEGKRMTIAAGFVCLDGIVLCADTQEVISGYTKNNTDKIKLWKDSGFGIGISGAGETELIEALSDQIRDSLIADYTRALVRFPDECLKIIQEVLLKFFNTSISPWVSFPKDERPNMPELLILLGVSNDAVHYQCLFRTSGTTVRHIEPGADCLGTGLLIAKSLTERLYSCFSEIDDMVIIACYILYHTKKWVDTCGGDTHLLVSSVENDFFGSPFSSADVQELERIFPLFDSNINNLLTVAFNPASVESNLETVIKRLHTDLSNIKSQISTEIVRGLARLKTKPSASQK
jgi:hypothetical protein